MKNDVVEQAPDFIDQRTQRWLAGKHDFLAGMAGKTYIITGASKGLGRAIACLCARYGARVILLSRDVGASQALIVQLNRDYSPQEHQAFVLDLTDMSSIESVALVLQDQHINVDGVFANAGIAADAHAITDTGYSRTFYINHIGHYALLGKLMPLLAQSRCRIVMQSSIRHRSVRWDKDFSLYFDANNRRFPNAYADSKFANIAYARYLDEACLARQIPLRAVCAHPGYVLTNINKNAHDATNEALLTSIAGGMWSRLVLQSIQRLGLAQASLYAGALPSIHAMLLTEPYDYTGPDGLLGLCGMPSAAKPYSAVYDREVAARLWQQTAAFTGVHYFN